MEIRRILYERGVTHTANIAALLYHMIMKQMSDMLFEAINCHYKLNYLFLDTTC